MPSPSWWQFDVLPRYHLPVLAVPLIAFGLVLAFWALTRLTDRRRIGALLVAASLGVGLPAAALTVNSASQHIDVVSTQMPMDNPVWNVRCDSAFQTTPMDNDLSRDTTAGCSKATKPWRWGAGAILLASIATLVGGIELFGKRRNVHRVGKPTTSETAAVP